MLRRASALSGKVPHPVLLTDLSQAKRGSGVRVQAAGGIAVCTGAGRVLFSPEAGVAQEYRGSAKRPQPFLGREVRRI